MSGPISWMKRLAKQDPAGLFVVVGLLGLAMVGCKTRTETGYEPRKLGDSPTVQKGYYAAPFSNEAREAASERAQRNDRRPDVGGNRNY